MLLRIGRGTFASMGAATGGWWGMMQSSIWSFLIILERARWNIFEYVEPPCISGTDELGIQKVD